MSKSNEIVVPSNIADLVLSAAILVPMVVTSVITVVKMISKALRPKTYQMTLFYRGNMMEQIGTKEELEEWVKRVTGKASTEM